jgi:hypothetical protein
VTTLRDYNARAVGIGWFREEDYPAAQALFKPTNYLPPWEEWLKRAEAMENDFKVQGYIVERVYIDPDTFPDWCRERGKRIDAQARMDFASMVVAEKYGRNQS